MTRRRRDFDVSRYASLPRMGGLFVTGTDTGVGKTLIAGAIARELRKTSRVEVLKPVATGCRRTREGLVSADAEFLAACADTRRTVAQVAPVRYAPAMAPNVAAARSGRPIDLEAIFDAWRELAGSCDYVVVEGVGGLLCPITDDFWVVHLAALMRLPVVIVARAQLGTINHTLLTLHAARSAGLTVAGVVINRYRVTPERPWSPQADVRELTGSDEDVAAMTNVEQIRRLGNVDVPAIVPDEPGNSVEKVTIGPDTSYVIAQTPWAQMARGEGFGARDSGLGSRE